MDKEQEFESIQVPAGSPPCLEPALQSTTWSYGPSLSSNIELARLLHSHFPGFQSLYPIAYDKVVEEHIQECNEQGRIRRYDERNAHSLDTEVAKKVPSYSLHDLLNDFTTTSQVFNNVPSPNSSFVFKPPDQSPTQPFDESCPKEAIPSTEILSAPVAPVFHDECTQSAVESGIALLNEKNFVRQDYIDLTPYLRLSQEDAAKRLGIPSSTLSKRWREATRNRKWPFRTLSKVEREIKTIVHNLPRGVPIEAELAQNLSVLLKKRDEEGRAVFIKKGGIQR